MNAAVGTSRIAALRGDLKPLATSAARYTRFGVDTDGSATVVAPMPWRAPRAKAFWLFEPLSSELLCTLACPTFYRAILAQMNGCFAFGLSLYGVPEANGMLNRSTLRPHSLEHANTSWRKEFVGLASEFHFGGAPLDDSENVGYFYVNEQIVAARKSGRKVQQWNSFLQFLTDELTRVEGLAHSNPAAGAAWHDALPERGQA